jgi:hypothetical protein
MAKEPSPTDNWRTEWRRNGAGVMAATFLVGGGWVSASQTFVTSKNGQLVHPSPYGWLLWVCAVGFAFGAYAWLTTYMPRLPMFGRAKARSAERWHMMNDLTERTDRNRPIQVELIDRDRPIPLAAPLSYQVAQIRQVLAKLREAEMFDFDFMTLDGGLKVVPRVGTDPSYEPLFISPQSEALAELADSGELTIEPDHQYRIHPAETSSDADPNSGDARPNS